jgi:hypothetical protein
MATGEAGVKGRSGMTGTPGGDTGRGGGRGEEERVGDGTRTWPYGEEDPIIEAYKLARLSGR